MIKLNRLFGIFVVLCACMYLVSPVSAMKLPSEYGYNECELIAKDFQKEYGGSLIWIAPKYPSSGAWVLGEYSAHLINYKYMSGNRESYYIDYGNQRIFETKEQVALWYKTESGYDSEIFNLGDGERPPYSLIWHY